MELTVSAEDLERELAEGRVPLLLDVRNRDEFAAAPVEGRRPAPTRNVPVYDILEDLDTYAPDIPDGSVILCGQGNGSLMVAEELAERGIRTRSLAGGTDAWGHLLVPRPLPGLPEGVVGWQVQRPAKGCLSYVIGVPGGRCLVVDPSRDQETYRELAWERDMTIAHVVDTHVHADHLSGGPMLAAAVGATYHVPPEDTGEDASLVSDPLVDGQELDLGDDTRVHVITMHLPGHTPGTTALLVGGILLVGDTVFVRGLGRPDLTGQADELARDLFRSVHERLEPMPRDTRIAPAHWSTPEEFDSDGLVTATLAEIFEATLLNEQAIERFVEEIVSTLPHAPESYDTIRLVNSGRLTLPGDELEVLDVGKNQCAAASTTGGAGR